MFVHPRFFMLAAALLVATPLAAQQVSFDSTSQGTAPVATVATAPTPAPAPIVGPMLQTAAVGFRADAASTTPNALAVASYGENSQNVALMVVGGAGLIVGAVIGGRSGTIVMLGSGILGLVGLFRYLQ